MLDPGSILSTVVGLAIRLFAWLIPSQAAIDAAAMNVRLVTISGNAACAAGADAEERQSCERRALALALCKHDFDVHEVKTARKVAKRKFEQVSALPIRDKVPRWKFWARRSALKKLQKRALQITALNETQYDCGFRLQRSADTCVELTNLLELSPSHGHGASTNGTEAMNQGSKASMTAH